MKEREALIIFDEVQRFPIARSFIKQLVADGRYDYLETGSLISIKKNLENIVIPSKKTKWNLVPLTSKNFFGLMVILCWLMRFENRLNK